MNSKIFRALAALALAVAVCLPAGAQIQQPSKDWTEIRGSWSGIQSPKEIVVQDGAAWQTLWAEHARGTGAEKTPPAVDFTREMVVGVFLGARTKTQPLEMEVVQDKSGEVVVEYEEGKPGTVYTLPVVCQPFRIKRLPKAQVVRIQRSAAQAKGSMLAQAQPQQDFGVRDAVAQTSTKLRAVFATQKADSLFLGGAAAKDEPKVVLVQLPPPPGQGQQKPKQGVQPPAKKPNGGLPPPPGGSNDSGSQRGGNLPPPPGGKLPPPPGGDNNQGGNLPPPPAYKPRPGNGNLPPPPGSGIPSADTGVDVTGYWHVYRDILGYAQERYGNWQSEDVAILIQRGGLETGINQGTSYTGDASSRDYRRRYILHWRWVGRDCDPGDTDRCARWEREWRWFYEDTRYSKPHAMRIVVEFDRDQALLPWEKESIRAHWDGSRVWLEYSDPSFQYSERGPIVDQQQGVATVVLTPGKRILRSPEREKVTAYLVKEGGRLKLVVEDARTREYAGETLEVEFQVYRVEKMSWRNPFGRDTKVAERTSNGPERISTDPSNAKRVVDLGITETGREFYIDSWSFRRANSRISAGSWVGRGKGNRVGM